MMFRCESSAAAQAMPSKLLVADWLIRAGIVSAVLLVSACMPLSYPDGVVASKAQPAGNEPRPTAAQGAAPVPEVDQQGLASWYGPRFHGRKTASGERYNQNAFTAAHPTYPFHTQLCVRSAENGKTVVVRVNDRGPYAGRRVIDLSKAAAQQLGMLQQGVKKVEIYKLAAGERDCHSALR